MTRPQGASWGRRGTAVAVDLFVLWLIPTTVSEAARYATIELWIWAGWTDLHLDRFVITIAAINWLLIAVQVGYLLAADVRLGQTYGKRVVGIAVVSDNTGLPGATWSQAVRRRVGQAALPLLPAAMVAAAVFRRRPPRPPQDRLSHTTVTMVDTAPRAPWRYLADLTRKAEPCPA